MRGRGGYSGGVQGHAPDISELNEMENRIIRNKLRGA